MKLRYEDYTVCWMSALPGEQAAALLDETHEKLPMSKHDTTYILGRIDVHNVVMACLPGIGTTETARCVARLEHGFKSLRFILLVGVGGGVPTIKDIRLGDVVVSMPHINPRGVVQYDYGTRFQDEHLDIYDTSLSPPSDILVTAVNALTTKDAQTKQQDSLQRRLYDSANHLVEKYPNMRSSGRPEHDRLFRAEYRHRDKDLTCEQCHCDTSQLVQRPNRVSDCYVRVHQGLIASGNEVMRDAKERDRLAAEKGVLCFEMEAAGLKTDLGWLVIRGICDYCDSHKNKDWQNYAAAMAAAYGRELLKETPGLKSEDDDTHSSDSRNRGAISTQEQMSGGQLNNFTGDIRTTGGKAFFGGNFRSDGPIHF